MLTRLLLLVILAALAVAVWFWKPSNDPAASGDAVLADSEREQLLDIPVEYPQYELVDPDANWAPAFCAAPSPPVTAKLSQSDDDDSHGDKLYFLFAKDLYAYHQARKQQQPVGQILVKESWQAEPAAPAEGSPNWGSHPKARVEVGMVTMGGDAAYRRGEQRELFVMKKLDPATPGTDEGWVYATLTADGSRVISAGRLDNCMSCHQSAGVDRLFGVAGDGPDIPE